MGEGEKEKECTTECKSRRRVGDGMRKGRRNCNKGRNKWKSDGSGPEVMFPVEEGTDQCSVYGAGPSKLRKQSFAEGSSIYGTGVFHEASP